MVRRQLDSDPADAQLGLLLIAVAVFVASYTGAIILVSLSAVGTASAAEIGLVVAMPGLAGVLLGIPSAALSARLGRRRLLLAGFAALIAADAGYLLAPDFLWLVPSQLALGLAMILFWPSALAAFAELRSRRSHELRQGANTLLQGLGSFAGAGAAGAVASWIGFPRSFTFLLPLSVAGLLVSLRLHETAPADARSSSVDLLGAYGGALRLWRGDRAYVAATLALLPWSMLWWVAGASFFVLYARATGHSAAFVGGLLALRIGVASLLRLAFAPITRRISLPRLLLAGNVVAGLGLGAAAASPDAPWLLLSAVFQGAGLSVVLPASNVMIMRGTTGSDRVVGLAMAASATNAAILVSPVILALASSTWGPAGPLITAGLIAIAASAALVPLVTVHRTRKERGDDAQQRATRR